MFSLQPFWLDVFKQAVWGVMILDDGFTAKKKKKELGSIVAVSVGISERDVVAGCALCLCADVGDQAMWDDARWMSRVDRRAGVH